MPKLVMSLVIDPVSKESRILCDKIYTDCNDDAEKTLGRLLSAAALACALSEIPAEVAAQIFERGVEVATESLADFNKRSDEADKPSKKKGKSYDA